MSHRPISLLLLAFALLGCTPAAAPHISRRATLGTAFTLAPQELAVFPQQGLEVRFLGIVEDSRCPHDVTCVWAGEVRVHLAVSDREKTELELLEGQGTTFGAHRYTVLEVRPQAQSEHRIAPEAYRITLRVEPSLDNPIQPL
jgi:hypothetical protein